MQTNTKRLGEYKSLQQKNSEKSSSPQPLSSQGHLAFHTASHCAKVLEFHTLKLKKARKCKRKKQNKNNDMTPDKQKSGKGPDDVIVAAGRSDAV